MSSKTTFPWLRRIRVSFEGLKGDKTRVMESDGTQKNLNISATIQKSLQSVASVSEVLLYNLSADSRNSFVRLETTATIEAGWDDGPFKGLRQAFRGTLLASQAKREGPDIVTILHLHAGRHAAVMADISRSWALGTPVRAVVESIARSMEGVTVDPLLIKGVVGTIGDSGMPISSDAETALNQLSRQYGFYWSVIDGDFQTVHRNPDGPGGILSHAGTVESPYLIAVNTVLNGVRRIQIGVDGQCTLNTNVIPGSGITIRSEIDPRANGEWRISKVEHSLSCFNSQSFITTFSGVGRRRNL